MDKTYRHEFSTYGRSRDTETIYRTIIGLRKTCNVIAPPGLAGSPVPNGFAVLWSEADVDSRIVSDGGEVYRTSKTGQTSSYTLLSSSIDKVAATFGVNWNPDRSGRLDDGRIKHFCMFKAVGVYTGIDGMPVMLSGTHRTDLQDGSPLSESFRNREGRMNEAMLRQQRMHILSISESKARSRAFRKAIGLRAMSLHDIGRPWVVFRISLTGETEDPETAQMFKRMVFQQAMIARHSMYGPPRQLRPVPAPVPALPEATLDDIDDDDCEPPSGLERQIERQPEPKALPAPQQAPEPVREPNQPGATHVTSWAVWPVDAEHPGWPAKGTPLTEVSTAQLERLILYCKKKVAGGGPVAEDNRRLCEEAQRVIDSRREPGDDRDDDEAPRDTGKW
jgi:hypothetical protein